jgi:hypothetical protein
MRGGPRASAGNTGSTIFGMFCPGDPARTGQPGYAARSRRRHGRWAGDAAHPDRGAPVSYPTPQQPAQPAHSYPPAPQQPKRVLGLPVGAVVAIVAALLTLCCICSIAGVFVWRFMPTDLSADPAPSSSTAKINVTITRCDIEAGPPRLARVEYKVVNESGERQSYGVHIEIKDAAGVTVDQGIDWVLGIDPGQTGTGDGNIKLTSPAGKTCHVGKVDL